MGEKWKIVYFEISAGKFPVKEFIDNLDEKAKAKVINALDLLTEFGTSISWPHAKKLTGTLLWELRTVGSNNIRIFYVAVVGKSFLLLHAFQKKKQKTDRKEIKLAEERLKNYYLRLK
jgi:phage-related protein